MLLLSTDSHFLCISLFFEIPVIPGGMKEVLLNCASVYDTISILSLQSGQLCIFKKEACALNQ